MSDPSLQEPSRSRSQDDASDVIPWGAPVAATILGALLMASFVIFSVVTGPGEAGTVPTALPATAQQATGFPDGYAAVTGTVAFRADVIKAGSDRVIIFVSSAVIGGRDPASVTLPEVAAWSLRVPGDEAGMVHQYAAVGVPGSVTIEFDQMLLPDSVVLNAILPGTVEHVTDRVLLPGSLPGTLSSYTITVGDHTIVIDELVIGDTWGSMRWHLEGGIAAKVEVVVTLDGTTDPTVLTSSHAAPLDAPIGSPLPPLWNTRGQALLAPTGQALSESSAPTGITVEFFVSVVTEPGVSVEVPVVSVVAP